MPEGLAANLEKERSLLRAVVDAAVDGILTIDSMGIVLTANPAIETIFGYLPEEVIGQNVRVLMPPPYYNEHDQYLANYRETHDRKIIGIGREVEGRRKDGTVFPVDLAVSETSTGDGPIFTGILRDITERKRAAEDIRRERALLKAVVETAVDGIMTIDELGAIQSANPAIERIFGYKPEELLGKNVRMLMPAPYHDEHDQYLKNYRSSGERKIIGIGRQVHGRRKDGTVFPLDLGVSETRTESGVIFTGIVRDISERMQAVELQIARDAAVQANAAKSEFLSRMSHELRTPLNAVLGFAQLLEMQYEDPKIQRATHSILKAGQHLLNLINEVLDLSRIEAGRLTISIEPVLLSQILLQTLDIVQPIASKAGITLDTVTPSCAEMYVMADRQRLVQVLINLLTNAVKFNRPSGRVQVFCDDVEGENHRILVRDSGVGITNDDMNRLFQPFERFGDLAVEGTGLGLVLSRRFIELMNGTLTLVESGPSGSTFCIELPKAQSAHTQAAGALAATRHGAFSSSLRGTVLYIEDNLSNMKLIEMLLETWPNINLIPAVQGNVGLELARSHTPDLIFLDLHLPDIQGVDVLRMLKADPTTASIPVVVVSADATPGQIRKLRLAGAYDYLTKPLDIDRFMLVLESLLPNEGGTNAQID